MPKSPASTRQAEILEAASHLILTHGVAEFSMAKLGKHTGLSRPAIYQYFASKEHVLAELIVDEIADLSNLLDKELAKHAEPTDQVRCWIRLTFLHLASERHRIIREFSMDLLPQDSRGLIKAMHGHLMLALMNPLTRLGVSDVMANCHLIYGAVSAAAKRVESGANLDSEAVILEDFTLAGIHQASRLSATN
jgi:AcrR family transcriptional regulator